MNRLWYGGALLAFLTLAGAGRADEAGTVAALKKLGATILYENNQPGRPVRAVYLNGKKRVTDETLDAVASLEHLQTLQLGGTKVTDAGLGKLASLKGLQGLDLSSTAVTDAGLKDLASLKSLQSLGLNFTVVTDAGLKELTGLTELRSLGLNGTKVTAEGVKELKAALPGCKVHTLLGISP